MLFLDIYNRSWSVSVRMRMPMRLLLRLLNSLFYYFTIPFNFLNKSVEYLNWLRLRCFLLLLRLLLLLFIISQFKTILNVFMGVLLRWIVNKCSIIRDIFVLIFEALVRYRRGFIIIIIILGYEIALTSFVSNLKSFILFLLLSLILLFW